MFTQMIRPQRILEIGTFVGYSTLCFAEGLEEGGEIHTLEIDDELEDVIRANFANSEHGHKIKLHIGDALDISLRLMRIVSTWLLSMETKRYIGAITKHSCQR